jgi:geranylgeranyl diphosphate synthase type I
VTTTLPASLNRARELVWPALRAAVDTLAPDIRPVAAYHFGWAEADGTPSEGGGGKAVRPALALASAVAAGAAPEVGVDGAMGVELVHNFSLLHDDIMDRDQERHHRPTAWTLFGEARAILAGDALANLSTQVLLRPGTEEGMRAASLLVDGTARMIAGQSEDMAREGSLDVSTKECTAMHAAKTGALLSCASAIGAVLAGAGEAIVRPLATFGIQVGIAFQAVDDQLGIWGRPELTGKPTWNDLRQRKSSLPVVAALEQRGAESARLRGLLGKPDLTEAEIAEAAELVEACGGRRFAADEAERRLELALREVNRAPIEPEAREELTELARFIVEREF